MITLFAHASHSMNTDSMSTLDHCMTVIIVASIIVTLLILVIVYLLTMWQPKPSTKTLKTKKRKDKK